MLSAITRFLFPKLCLYCREIHPGKFLLCERCVLGLDLIFPKGRCHTCFRQSNKGKCLACLKYPSPWYQAGGVFSTSSSGVVLLQDPDLYAKEIAAFFMIQFIRLRWPIPDAFYVDSFLKPVSVYIPKFLLMKKVSMRKEYAGKKILFFSENQEGCKIPEFLLGSRIFLLSYTVFEENL